MGLRERRGICEKGRGFLRREGDFVRREGERSHRVDDTVVIDVEGVGNQARILLAHALPLGGGFARGQEWGLRTEGARETKGF